MTVENTNNTISYTGNSSVTTFAYNFLTYSAGHIFIYFDDVLQSSGFTITGVGDDNGGDIIFLSPPDAGVTIRIDRTVPDTQLLEYQEYGPFPAKANERGLDLLTMAVQQNAREITRRNSELDEKKMDKRPLAEVDNVVIFDSEGNAKDSGKKLNEVGNGGSYVGENPPTFPQQGDRWTRCTDMKGFIWYVDADGGQWVEDRPSYDIGGDRVVPFKTLDEAINAASIFEGAALNLKERSLGNGGGAMWDVVLTSSVVPNGYDIVQSSVIPSLSLKLRLVSGYTDFKQWGVNGLDVNFDTLAAQAAINSGIPLVISDGDYVFTELEIPEKTSIKGRNTNKVKFIQADGSNRDFIKSKNFDTEDADGIEIKNITINGNYFAGEWNDNPGVLNNTAGNGVSIRGRATKLDIVLENVAGIGFYSPDVFQSESNASSDDLWDVSIVGRDFGKEGIVIKGPNDGILRKAWIGRVGILPRPAAESQISTSDVFPGEPSDGIVFDGVNLEIGQVHVYAAWSGTGFRTRNVVRLTGGVVISESNRAQVNISSNTYGFCNFDVRRLALLHPDWSQTIPTYTYPNPEFDAVSIYSDEQFKCNITCKRTITNPERVVGVSGCVVYGPANVNFIYSNSTAPAGDPEAGSRYSGIGLSTEADGGVITVNGKQSNGALVNVLSSSASINFSARDCTLALKRDSLSNSKRGNNISGSIKQCGIGFDSVGTPTAEVLNIGMDMGGSAIPFSGDILDTGRGQIWNISASLDNVAKSTKQYLQSADMPAGDSSEQTISIPHNFLFTPTFPLIQFSINDRPQTNTLLEYCFLTTITATELVFAYKYSTNSGPTFNQRISATIG